MQKVIIIGATSGIGLELAKLYIQNGDRVGITGRRGHLLDSIREKFPAQVETECFDVMGDQNIAHLESLIKKINGLDVLIYNAGFGEISETLERELEKRIVQTNVNGFIDTVNYAFNFFIKKGSGRIAATSSVASVRGNSMAPSYSASKAFMSIYMEGLHLKACRLKRKREKINISVTDIQPGFVNTKQVSGAIRFWVVPVEKAALQIFQAISKGKKRVYISHRWRIVAFILRWLPYFILKRFA